MDTELLPFGTEAIIFSKVYYSVIAKRLETLEIEKYYSILIYIGRYKGCTQKQICDGLFIDKATMVKIIDYLSDIEYIERKTNPNNRREHNIFLTELGLERIKKVKEAFQEVDDYIFEGLSLQERADCVEKMRAMSERLKELPQNAICFNYKKSK
jgi:MarR family transcriptional regulator, transcriptional regulator for hemolysin